MIRNLGPEQDHAHGLWAPSLGCLTDQSDNKLAKMASPLESVIGFVGILKLEDTVDLRLEFSLG